MELHPGAAGHNGDTESSAVVEPASGTRRVGFAERQPFPQRRVLGQLGSLPRIRARHPALRTSEAGSQRAANFRLQRPPENGFWMDMEFNAPEWRDVARGQRPGRSWSRDTTDPPLGWRALTSRGHISRVPSGLSSHKQSPPQVPAWSICWHPVHLFTSGGRVECGTSDLPGSAPSSPLVRLPLSAHSCPCSRHLDVRGHHWAACGRAGVLGLRGFSLESAAARVCREGGRRLSECARR